MRRFVPAVLAVLGVGLAVAGVVVFAVANRAGAPLDFGWTAYTPLEPGPVDQNDLILSFDDRWTVLWTGTHLLGAALIVLGLLVVTGLGGWFLGRRAGSRR